MSTAPAGPRQGRAGRRPHPEGMTRPPAPPHRPDPVRLRVRRPSGPAGGGALPARLPARRVAGRGAGPRRPGAADRRSEPAATAGLVGHVQELVDQHTPSALVLVAYTAEAERGRAVYPGRAGRAGGSPDHRRAGGRRPPLVVADLRHRLLPPRAARRAGGLAAGRGRGLRRAARPRKPGGGGPQAAGPDPGEWDRLRRLARELRPALRRLGSDGRLAAMAAAVVERVRDPALSDADALRLALLAREVRVRDVACAMITREHAETTSRCGSRWWPGRRPAYASAPLCLLGMAAWVSGNGALQNCCCDRVRATRSRLLDGRSAGGHQRASAAAVLLGRAGAS